MSTPEQHPHKIYRVVWGPQRFYMSLGWKTLIAFALVVFLPMIGLLTLTSETMREGLEEEVRHSLHANLNSAVDAYQRPLHDVRIALSQAADSPAVAAALAAADGGKLKTILERQAGRFPYVDVWLAIDREGVIRGRIDGLVGIHPELSPGLTRRLRTLDEAIVSNEAVSREFYLSETNVRFVSLPPRVPSQLVIAPSRNQGFLVGLVALQDAGWLAQRLQGRITLHGGYAALLDLDRVIASSHLAGNPWLNSDYHPSGPLVAALRNGRQFQGEIALGADRMLLVADPLLNSELQPVGAIAVATTTQRIDQHLARNNKQTYGFIAVGLALSFLIAFLAFRDTITPLQAIVNAQLDFANGHHSVRTEIETKDEFERLGIGFNRMAEHVAAQQRRLEQYNALSSLVNLALDPVGLLQGTLDKIIDISRSQLGAIYLLEERSNRLTPYVAYALDLESLGALKIGEGLPGQAALEKEVKRLREIPERVDFGFKLGAGDLPPRELAYFPLIYRGELLGLLMIGTVTGYPEDEFVLLEHLTRQLSIILNDTISQQRIAELNVRDSLTGVDNRVHFTAQLEVAWNEATRYGTQLSLLMIDIDHFRQFADRYGFHLADTVLTTVASVLKKSLRKADVVARFGENRFVVMMRHTDLEQAMSSAEKIRKNIIGTTIPQLERERITISIGAVCYPDTPSQSPIELVKHANEVLMSAKDGGRNRVVAA